MSFIFVSYARSDGERVHTLVSKLQADCFDVRYDLVQVSPGRDISEEVERAIRQASCVIVVWSLASVASNWVKAEAAIANSRGNLLPVLFDKTDLPLPFAQLHTLNLTSWNGDSADPEFIALEYAILSILGHSRASPTSACHVVVKWLESRVGTETGWVSTLESIYKSQFVQPLREFNTKEVVECLQRFLDTRASYKKRGPVLLALLAVLLDKLPYEPRPGMRGEDIDKNIKYLNSIGVVETPIISHKELVPLLNAVMSDCWA